MEVDLLVIGHISKDINIDLERREEAVGGAVVFTSCAARQAGASLLAVTKRTPTDDPCLAVFRDRCIPVVACDSTATTSIRNTYHTADRERRTCEALAQADAFLAEDIPTDITARIYYLGGLMLGEFPPEFVRAMAARGDVALDVQGFVRVNDAGALIFRDWAEKRDLIPLIRYLKTDAAEAELLTGTSDRRAAARILHEWGAREVVLTHNTEVLACVEGEIYAAPFTPQNLSGRTGRGDTCFGSYCAWRRDHGPEEACRFAAALTSLKMERPGPFSGTVAEVEAAIEERYTP